MKKTKRLQRIDIVIIPRRGKSLTYAYGPMTVGSRSWKFLEVVIPAYLEYIGPKPKEANANH